MTRPHPSAPVLFSLLLLALTAVGGQRGDGPTTAEAPPPAPKVEAVAWGGEIWSEAMRRAAVLFQDGAMGVAVPGGTIWLFGDTFLGDPPAEPGGKPRYDGAHGATLAFLPAGETALPPKLRYLAGDDGRARNPIELLPGESPDKQRRFWPLGGVTANGKTYVYYAMIEATEADPPWNFRDVGCGLAVLDGPPPAKLRRLTRAGGAWQFPVRAIQVVERDGWLYLYEVIGEGAQRGCLLARVAPAKIEDPTAYAYYAGDGRWSPKRDEARVILREAYGQVSVAWNERLGAYLLVTSSDFAHPQEIQFRVGRHPWGPWSPPTRLPVPPRAGRTTKLIYCAFLHPELAPPDGSEAVVTFCRMLAGDWEFSNPETVLVRFEPEAGGVATD